MKRKFNKNLEILQQIQSEMKKELNISIFQLENSGKSF